MKGSTVLVFEANFVSIYLVVIASLYSEIESFSGTVHVLVDVLDAQAKRIEHAKLKVCFWLHCESRMLMGLEVNN